MRSLIFILFFALVSLVIAQHEVPLLPFMDQRESKICLLCICRDKADCGITWDFWTDGGKVGNDYHSCVKDLLCVQQTMANYYHKYVQDCTADAVMNCSDYARIHQHGPYACQRPPTRDVLQMEACVDTYHKSKFVF